MINSKTRSLITWWNVTSLNNRYDIDSYKDYELLVNLLSELSKFLVEWIDPSDELFSYYEFTGVI